MTYQNEFDELPDDKQGFLASIGPKAAFFIVLIALSFMIGVVWKLYVGANSREAGQNVPIVRADDTPYKIIPDDPGGMEIPNKDSTLFSSLQGDDEDERQVENLLADDENEEPMPRSQLFAGLNTNATPDLHAEAQQTPLDEPLDNDEERIVEQAKEAEAIIEDIADDGIEAIEVEKSREEKAETVEKLVEETDKSIMPSVPSSTATEDSSESNVKLELLPEPEAAKPAPKPEVKTTNTATTAPAAGDYYVQLASVTSRMGAESEWKKLKSKYSSQLAGYSHRVEAADLGARGTFYRIQAGPVSKAQANEACTAIKRIDPNGCLVKK